MTIPDEKIEELRRLYKNRFGVEISKKEAYIKAMNLLDIVRAVYCQNSAKGNTIDAFTKGNDEVILDEEVKN